MIMNQKPPVCISGESSDGMEWNGEMNECKILMIRLHWEFFEEQQLFLEGFSPTVLFKWSVSDALFICNYASFS